MRIIGSDSVRILPLFSIKDPLMLRRLLTAALASCCFSLAGLALGLAIANLAGMSAHSWMQRWEKQRHVGDPKVWNAAYDRLKLARRLHPLSANYSADLGRLMEWQSWRFLPDGPASAKYRSQASRFYVETIRKRPSWGFAWAHYAENELLSGNRAGEFQAALQKAMLLAPWEPQVQRKVAWMGMATWNELPIYMRDMVEQSIRRAAAIDSDPEELVRLAVQYNWLDRLQPMMRTERQTLALKRVLGNGSRR